MRRTRRLIWVVVAMGMAVLLASGVALAANIRGTDGADKINGTADADSLDGMAGDDTISGLAGSDKIDGGGGNDKLYGVDDKGTAESGDDTIRGGFGTDTIWGGPGADTLEGGAGNDTIRAGQLDEAAVDTVWGGDGDDTIYTANLPASKDTVSCGADTDKVVVDSLDEVGANCEKVEKIQEREPTLADGTYQLVPDSSSECDLGKGSFTISTDATSGERNAKVDLEEKEVSKDTTPPACQMKIDYETPVSLEGEVSAAGTNTRSYTGEKLSQDEINNLIQEDPEASEETAPASSKATSGAVSAQYAWTVTRFTHQMLTFDPVGIPLNRTTHTLRWWHNGYDTDYYGNSWAYCTPISLVTTWYRSGCYWDYYWYGYSWWRSWIGSQWRGEYYNFDFNNPLSITIAIHYNRIYGYSYGTAGKQPSYYFAGDYWFVLTGVSYGWYG